jgi:pimeloyl-ACP methyl ester carboxylesterase
VVPAVSSGRFLLPDGRCLAYDDVGDAAGRVVVYLHGIPDSRWCRHPDDGIAERLGIRLLSVDRPGWGDSDPDPDGTFLSFAADLATLADEVGVAEYGTLGWSGAGLHALACAVHDPDRVIGVGVASALAPIEAVGDAGLTDGLDEQTKLFVETAGTMPAADLAVLAEQVLAGNWTDDPDGIRDMLLSGADPSARRDLTTTPGLVDRLVAGVQLALRQGTAAARHDYELLASPTGFSASDVNVPVHLWYGGHDTGAPPAMGRWYADHLPDATLTVDDNASHFLVFTRWAEVLSWFAGL